MRSAASSGGFKYDLNKRTLIYKIKLQIYKGQLQFDLLHRKFNLALFYV